MKHKIKFAFNKEHAPDVKTFYIDQFKINFIDGETDNFINELYLKYEESEKLRKPVNINLNLQEKIEELIAENQLNEALNEAPHFSVNKTEDLFLTISTLLL